MVVAIARQPQRDRARGFLPCLKGKLRHTLGLSLSCEAGIASCKISALGFIRRGTSWQRHGGIGRIDRAFACTDRECGDLKISPKVCLSNSRKRGLHGAILGRRWLRTLPKLFGIAIGDSRIGGAGGAFPFV